MWSYYGAKTNIVDHYPKPKHDLIIEPFAGTARYALKYFEKDILLVDKYDVIIKIWSWLQKCSPNDILKLPRPKHNDVLDDFTFDCLEARYLMGFLVGSGAEKPRNKVGYRKTTDRPNHVNYNLKKIAAQLYKIKHWQFRCWDYETINNNKATWFIDPPYQFGGEAYYHSNKKINFEQLNKFCLGRKGQVIVCENTKANWMNFKPIIKQRGSVHTTTEAIWTNEKTIYDNEQTKLNF